MKQIANGEKKRRKRVIVSRGEKKISASLSDQLRRIMMMKKMTQQRKLGGERERERVWCSVMYNGVFG